MRLMSVMVAAALAMSTSAAMAQGAPGGIGSAGPPSGAAGGPGLTQAPQHVPAVDPLTAQDVSHFSGTAVYGSGGKKLGSVSTELMDPKTHRIDRLVVTVGGVLGMGGHKVAMSLDQFRWDSQKEGFAVAKTGDELKSMPAWAEAGSTSGSGSSTPPSR